MANTCRVVGRGSDEIDSLPAFLDGEVDIEVGDVLGVADETDLVPALVLREVLQKAQPESSRAYGRRPAHSRPFEGFRTLLQVGVIVSCMDIMTCR